MKVKLSDLAKMSEAERNETLAKLVQAAKRPRTEADWKRHEARMKAYEAEVGMTLQEVREKLSKGEIQETDTICSMLLWAKSWERRSSG